jgi:hypothetical protein
MEVILIDRTLNKGTVNIRTRTDRPISQNRTNMDPCPAKEKPIPNNSFPGTNKTFTAKTDLHSAVLSVFGNKMH